MTNPSPAAQAVFWEFNRAASGKPYDWHYLPAIAAALRAAADEVVPYDDLKGSDPDAWTRDDIRCDLLAIADELEQLDD